MKNPPFHVRNQCQWYDYNIFRPFSCAIAGIRDKNMKEEQFTDIICKKFCRFYKGGKEEMQCGTYRYLREHFPSEKLRSLVEDISASPDLGHDEEIRDLICSSCEFLVDGCDFRDGLDSPPCGGYTIIEYLLSKGLLEKK